MERGRVKAMEHRRKAPRRLSFDSLPVQVADTTEMASPPLQRPGSIPFRWEESPGKPKTELDRPPPTVKSLAPPPRAASPQSHMSSVKRTKEGEGRNKARSVSPWGRVKGRMADGGACKLLSHLSSPSPLRAHNRRGEQSCAREEGRMVRITGLRRSSSLIDHSTSSQWFANVYGNIKQVVRRNKEGMRSLIV